MSKHSSKGLTHLLLSIMHCCHKQWKTFILIVLTPVVLPHIATLVLASVPACHPASYGPLSRPQTLHRGTLITGCLLQELQVVGPKQMRCQALLKQEHINVSVCGRRAGQRRCPAGVDRGNYLGEQRCRKLCKDIPRVCLYMYKIKQKLFTHARYQTQTWHS